MTIAIENDKNLPIIENWLAQENGALPVYAFEFILYSDAYIVGQIEDECGPYKFLNTVPGSTYRSETILPYVLLRCFCIENEERVTTTSETDAGLYHGGSAFIDEISAITSLFLGVRIKSSSAIRVFEDLTNDLMGRPIYWDYKPVPTLEFNSRGSNIPCAIEQKNLSILHDMKDVLELNSKEAVAFMRSARLYQQALWVAESDPNSAWLMLVAALESIAGVWRENSFSNEDIIQETNPGLVAFLKESNSEHLICGVADLLSNLTGSTKKFLNFCLNFLPGEPERRPLEFQQVKWTRQSWKKIFLTIYNYRSKALHEGTPFPWPMGERPYKHSRDAAFSEKGTIALAVRQGNTSWIAEDVPINLNLFVKVTQEILLSWLKYTANQRRNRGVP